MPSTRWCAARFSANSRGSCANFGTTTLFVTHDFDEALKFADRIVVMRAGAVEQVATPDELLERPATQYVRDLVHAGDDVYRDYYLHVRETLR